MDMALTYKRKKAFPEIAFDFFNYTMMILFAMSVFYPFYYCVMLSFNDGKDAQMGGIYFWPRVFTFENYLEVFKNPLIGIAAANSILRTVIGILTGVFFTAMFSYAVSRKNVVFRKFYMVFGLITMYFWGGLIPNYLVIRGIGLVDNFAVYILPKMFSMFHALILFSFFKTIPDSLEESAKIDGANDLLIFIRIIIPVSTPVIATIALFTGVAQWNEWLDTIIFTRKEGLQTLSALLIKMLNTIQFYETLMQTKENIYMKKMRGLTSNSFMLATMTVTAFPVIVLYPFLQKYFIKGLMIGSIKG